ncbi:unnamed protein product [Sphagnum tenellum]
MSEPTREGYNHSIKVPRLYKVAAFILEKAKAGQGSVRNLVYDEKQQSAKKRHPNVSALLALVMECVNHSAEIDAVLARTAILADQPRLQRHLAEILVTELLWGKGTLPGESRPVLTVLEYEQQLRAALQEGGPCRQTSRVRFPRVNTLTNTLRRVIKQLKSEDYVEIIYERSAISYSSFMSLVKALRPGEFLLDLHVENLIIFAPGTLLHDHPLYLDGSLQVTSLRRNAMLS